MTVVVVVGAQWGDEGKGKIVDVYSRDADVVVRYSGGANTGHTLVLGGRKTVLRLMPSGVFRPRPHIVLGQGMAVDPEVLLEELEILAQACGLSPERLTLSDRAHLVLPHHMLLDAGAERLSTALGTTKRGMGPAYQDRAGRRGVRVLDLLHPVRFRSKLAENLEAWLPIAKAWDITLPSVDAIADKYLRFGDRLAPYIRDAGRLVDNAIRAKQHVLLDVAQPWP